MDMSASQVHGDGLPVAPALHPPQPESTFTWVLRSIDLTSWKPVQSISHYFVSTADKAQELFVFPMRCCDGSLTGSPSSPALPPQHHYHHDFSRNTTLWAWTNAPQLLIMHTGKMTLERPMGPKEEAGIHWPSARGRDLGHVTSVPLFIVTWDVQCRAGFPFRA